ncbi:hypothetical protein OHR68_31430 [Spirillospora sp. NBC_00431]
MAQVITPGRGPGRTGQPASLPGHPVWCAACEWRLDAPQAPRKGMRGRFDQWSSRKLQASTRSSSALRPGQDAARVISLAMALCVHAFTILLLTVATWLLVAVRNPVTIAAAMLCLMTAWALRPRFGSPRRLPDVRRRLRDGRPAPPSRPLPRYTPVGRASAQQKVALLGHEVAHDVNADARHGVVVGISLATLAQLHAILLPGPSDNRVNYLIDLCTRAALALLMIARAPATASGAAGSRQGGVAKKPTNSAIPTVERCRPAWWTA